MGAPGIGDPLERYRAILLGRAYARYLLTRSVSIDETMGTSTGERWEVHHARMYEQRVLVAAGTAPSMASKSLMDLKRELAGEALKACCLCERDCRVDRTRGVRGRCGVIEPRIASHFVHMGEEEPLVPSFTVFFAGCNLECVFCQNYDISTRPGCGREIPAGELADIIDRRAEGTGAAGIRNVNWVGGDPTPNLHYILDVLSHTGANIPQVWNSNMYLSERSMVLLDGVIDIYLTDLKYGNDACALRLSGVPGYMRVVTRNHLMAASQGEVMVRHLMLPGHLHCCTMPIIDWLADNMPGAAVNIMAQYRPEHRARDYPELRGRIPLSEHNRALDLARQKGLRLI